MTNSAIAHRTKAQLAAEVEMLRAQLAAATAPIIPAGIMGVAIDAANDADIRYSDNNTAATTIKPRKAKAAKAAAASPVVSNGAKLSDTARAVLANPSAFKRAADYKPKEKLKAGYKWERVFPAMPPDIAAEAEVLVKLVHASAQAGIDSGAPMIIGGIIYDGKRKPNCRTKHTAGQAAQSIKSRYLAACGLVPKYKSVRKAS